MSAKNYEALLTGLSPIGEIQGLHAICLKTSERVLAGGCVEISLPTYERGMVRLDITRPIWGKGHGSPPEPAPPKEVIIPVQNAAEAVETVFGLMAGANYLGSSLTAVQGEVKAGWEIFCSNQHQTIAWDTARPQVQYVWDTVGSMWEG